MGTSLRTTCSFDLLGLHDDDNTGGQDREQSGTSSEGQTLSTGRSYQPLGDGLVYRQPDNPTRWSRRGSEQPVIPEENNPGPSSEGDKDAAAPERGEGSGEAISYYNAETRKFRRRGMALRGWRGNSGSGTTGCRGGTLGELRTVAGKPGPDQGYEGPGVGEPYGSGPSGTQYYRECPIAIAP